MKTRKGYSYIIFSVCFILASFTGCNLMKSPISMVKKFNLWQLSEDDRWRDNPFSNPTWERLIKEYKYFSGYNSSNWSKQKLGGQWYLHYVDYSAKFNKTISNDRIGGFVINNKTTVSVRETINYTDTTGLIVFFKRVVIS